MCRAFVTCVGAVTLFFVSMVLILVVPFTISNWDDIKFGYNFFNEYGDHLFRGGEDLFALTNANILGFANSGIDVSQQIDGLTKFGEIANTIDMMGRAFSALRHRMRGAAQRATYSTDRLRTELGNSPLTSRRPVLTGTGADDELIVNIRTRFYHAKVDHEALLPTLTDFIDAFNEFKQQVAWAKDTAVNQPSLNLKLNDGSGYLLEPRTTYRTFEDDGYRLNVAHVGKKLKLADIKSITLELLPPAHLSTPTGANDRVLIKTLDICIGNECKYVPAYHWLLLNRNNEIKDSVWQNNVMVLEMSAGLTTPSNAKYRSSELKMRQHNYGWRDYHELGSLPKVLQRDNGRPSTQLDHAWSGEKHAYFFGDAFDRLFEALTKSGPGTQRKLFNESKQLLNGINSRETMLNTMKTVFGPRYIENGGIINAGHFAPDSENPLISRDLPGNWWKDEMFGYQMVAGVDPLIIEKPKEIKPEFWEGFQKTCNAAAKLGKQQGDQCVQKMEDAKKELPIALKENRLFVLDLVEDMRKWVNASQNILDGDMAYVWGPHYTRTCMNPYVIMVVPPGYEEAAPLPKFIQLMGDDTRVFFEREKDNDATWILAKMLSMLAIAAKHELWDHLGRTHLIAETVIISTERNLPRAHPIYRLLRPHGYGTVEINYDALAPAGLLDRINEMFNLGSPLAEYYFSKWKLEDNGWEHNFKDRGVGTYPKYYPARDHAEGYWKAINNYVGNVVRHFYTSDAAVKNDKDLENWAADVRRSYNEPRNIPFDDTTKSIPAINDVNTLITVISNFIYTASVVHHTTNFPQFEFMGYLPNTPTAVHPPASLVPKRENYDKNWTWKDVYKFMPGDNLVIQQTTFTQLLSRFDGRYTPSLSRMFEDEDWFDGQWWEDTKAEFKRDLQQTRDKNVAQNEKWQRDGPTHVGVMPYWYLSREICRSISV